MALIPSIIQAQPQSQEETQPRLDGWYIGAGIGSGEVEVVGHNRTTAVIQVLTGAGYSTLSAFGSEDDGTQSWNLHLGFQFNPTWSIELGYEDLGSTNGTFFADIPDNGGSTLVGVLDSDYKSLSIAAIAKWPLRDWVSLVGKLGVHYWQHDFDLRGSQNLLTGSALSVTGSFTDRDSGHLFGGGFSFRASQKLRFELLWERFDNIENKEGIDVKSLSVNYFF